ncbi:MAG: hypothetical protein ABI743_13245, partial [bacterium]
MSRTLLWLCVLVALTGCAQRRPAIATALTEALAVPDLNTELLGNLETEARPLKGEVLLGRAIGPLTRDGHRLAWTDPQLGILLVDIANPNTRRPLDPRPLARLVPQQQPADCVLMPNAVVVRSAQGPYALELFVCDSQPGGISDSDADWAEQSRWHHATTLQRGHYDALAAASGGRVLAWAREANTVDCWQVDAVAGTLQQTWHWTLPAHTHSLAVDGDYLAIGVTDTEFQSGGRARIGSGVVLYDLASDPTQPTLLSRWLSPSTDPPNGLLWYGRGLLVTQGLSVRLLQRDQQSSLKPLGAITAEASCTPLAASGRYVWLRSNDAVVILDVADPRHPVWQPGRQLPLQAETPFVVYRNLLWYLSAAGGAPTPDVATAILPGAPDPTRLRRPVTSLFAAGLTSITQGSPSSVSIDDSARPPLPAALGVYEGYAYLSLGVRGVAIYKLGVNPADPFGGARFVTAMKVRGEVQDLVIDGHWAYCTNASTGFQVLDLRNPEAPLLEILKRYTREGSGFLLHEGRQLLAAGEEFSISRITQPGVLYVDQSTELPGHAEGLAQVGLETVVSCGDGGMMIFDANEGHPLVIVNHFRTSHHWGRLGSHNGLLYAAMDHHQLATLDIAHSSTPDIKHVEELGDAVTALAVSGDTLLVGLRLASGAGEVRR